MNRPSIPTKPLNPLPGSGRGGGGEMGAGIRSPKPHNFETAFQNSALAPDPHESG